VGQEAEPQGGPAPSNEDPQGQAGTPPAPAPHEPPPTDDDGEPDPIEALAHDMGWKPQDQFSGPPEAWKPADEFIRSGREIQRNYARDLKEMRSTLDTVAKTSAQVLQDRLEEQRAELATKFNEAVEDGNATEAYKIGQRIDDLGRRATTVQQPQRLSPEAQEFQERHKWFGVDQAATARAIQVCNQMAADGVADHAVQLRAAERTVKAEYPELFEGQSNGLGRPAPTVHQPGGRAAPPSNRQKGFHDMPKAAQDIATDMENRGVIAKKDDYVKKFWQNAEGER
jgi:hypothetical protein